ncbi:unnamed protein product [Mytilus edulis]|uniref:Fibrinogen C-terminal domain-containing protein n=1 Tax=Mytilus edulis TaxID=6550 RepID=A0A8S3S934_MYTED|nr:unnamed protein product [Mytilus edulis]
MQIDAQAHNIAILQACPHTHKEEEDPVIRNDTTLETLRNAIQQDPIVQIKCVYNNFAGNVVQKRFNGTVSFDRFWSNYKTGFGDITGEHWLGDSMTDLASQPMNGMKFTTRDKDNDIEYHGTNCATRKKGGWWYASCTYSNINGIYKEEESADSNHWYTFDVRKGLRKTKIMTKPNLEI